MMIVYCLVLGKYLYKSY